MPMPSAVAPTGASLPISEGIAIDWQGCRNAILARAADRFLANLGRLTGADPRAGAHPAHLTVQCSSNRTSEDYALSVGGTGATLRAGGRVGVLRGFATLLQLIARRSDGYVLTGVSITDRPRFTWRGLMIDVSRHFMPLELLERQLDAMEAVKLNVLHLHLSDDQGIRVESLRFPKIQSVGSHGQFYTQDEIRELVRYASDRGVSIVPEFDMPGHSRALLAAYPELGAIDIGKPGEAPTVFDPAKPEVYRFLGRFLGEMDHLFPDRHMHFGGDEVDRTIWERNPGIAAFMHRNRIRDAVALQAYFNRRVVEILKHKGKVAIGWDEVLDGDFPKDGMVQTWRSAKTMARSVEAGHHTVVSGGYYLDTLLPASKLYRADPVDPLAYGMSRENYDAVKAVRAGAMLPDAFALDPSIRLMPSEERFVRGGEAAMWSEETPPEIVEGRIWPRAAAIAERLWSPAAIVETDDMYRRLAQIDRELDALGVGAGPGRQAMIRRLTLSADTTAVELLASVVEPVKNFGHWHAMRNQVAGRAASMPPQSFDELADAVAPESLIARAFEQRVHELLRGNPGDPALSAALRAQLTLWRDNHARFVAAASGSPALQDAIPVSRDLRDLATLGLGSLDALDNGRRPASDWTGNGEALLAAQDAWEAASATVPRALTAQQPPADLLVAIVPGIRALVVAARQRQ
jgi:hexosaminidase